MDAKRLGQAFRLGCLFGKGLNFSKQKSLSFDEKDETVKFRTLKDGRKIAIEDGEVVGGAGTSVGPDKLPSFGSFSSSQERKGQSFTKNVRQYAEIHLKPIVEALRYPKGMPVDCERIVMGTKQIRELAAHMNDNKVKVLPWVADIYRKGSYREAVDTKHIEIEKVIYTTATINIDGKDYDVEIITKKRKPSVEGGSYVQYGIGKADEKKGASDSVICSKSRAAVSSLSMDTITQKTLKKAVFELVEIRVKN